MTIWQRMWRIHVQKCAQQHINLFYCACDCVYVCVLMVPHSWVPCQAAVLRFSGNADLTRQINLRKKKRREQKNCPSLCLHPPHAQINYTHTQEVHIQGQCSHLSPCTHTHARTDTHSRKDSTMLMWHLSVPQGCGWDYVAVCVYVWKSDGRKFITAVPLSVRSPGTELLTGTWRACWELSLMGKHTQYGGTEQTYNTNMNAWIWKTNNPRNIYICCIHCIFLYIINTHCIIKYLRCAGTPDLKWLHLNSFVS